MIVEISIGAVAFVAGLCVASKKQNEAINTAIAQGEDRAKFDHELFANQALRHCYSFAINHLYTANHHAQDLITEIKYRKSFQDKEELSGAIEKAEDFLAQSETLISDMMERLKSMSDEANLTLTKDECNTVEYVSDWSDKLKEKIAVLKHLIKENHQA